MANRKRNVQLHFMVTEHERSLIDEKMNQLGTKNYRILENLFLSLDVQAII